jgi:hypothetical protein
MPPNPFNAALGPTAALGILWPAGVLCCFVVGGDRELPFSAVLGLAAALGLAFGVRASWIAVAN